MSLLLKNANHHLTTQGCCKPSICKNPKISKEEYIRYAYTAKYHDTLEPLYERKVISVWEIPKRPTHGLSRVWGSSQIWLGWKAS